LALPLACTVRGCGLPLQRRERLFACARGHSYDVARSGYVNLLQPQDRRSLAAGDSREAVDARARLLASGIGRTVLETMAAGAAGAVPSGELPEIVDLGCGSGDLLAAVARLRPIAGIGIDLSTPATDRAARRFPAMTWVVANVDRRLPLLDESIDVVLSLHARRHPAECARVLVPGGALLVAVPAPDDLVELRQQIQGRRVERDRSAAVIAEHQALFTLVDRATVREQHRLTEEPLRDLLRGTYRGERTSEAARVEALGSLDVTVASDLLTLRRK
jgi:23S rRNA (guanine745-N1)-methyltransferase